MKTNPKATGNCFDANGREFQRLAQRDQSQLIYKMVHGIVINQKDNKPMAHAWIEAEFGEIVICLDFSNDHVHSLTQQTYYSIGKIKEENTIRYDLESFNAQLVKHENWGHWKTLNVDR